LGGDKIGPTRKSSISSPTSPRSCVDRRRVYTDGGGQNITLFALSEAELGEMRRRAGLDVNWICVIPAHIAAILRSYETERGNK
jgi:hypothetical protein